jgi:aminopeptidase N
MNRIHRKYLVNFALGTILAGLSVTHAESSLQKGQLCRHFQPEDLSSVDAQNQKYPPVRRVDIGHFSLDVTPDFKNRSVAGTATFTFRPIAKPLKELRLDADKLDIKKVESSVKISGWENTDRALIVTFAKPLPPNRPAKLSVTYEAEPTKGLYFRTPEMGYKPSDTHIWTQGETTMGRHWYPCFDAPNEFFTSTMTCRVPKGMVVLSNGRKASDKIDPKTGLKVVSWEQEKPHVNYLITLVAGYFKRIEEKHGDLSMSFWTTPSDFANAANSFRETKQCMEYFEKEIGVPYPWAKYDQVCVQDFSWGGMENTSMTTLNVSTLFNKETENLRSSQGLVAHELAHQWFGDLVTCKDWSHTWLNEGFATYYTHLFAGHKDGRETMLHGLYRDLKRLTGRTNDTTAMVNRKYKDPADMFRQYGILSYTKGSWVLNMLRSQLGPKMFQKVVKTYLNRHKHGNVMTEDLRSVIEEMTGNSYDRFFDQYVYHAHHPELDISYSWDKNARSAKLSIKQVQKINDNVLLFHVPLPVRFDVEGEKINRTIRVTKAAEDFYFPLKKAPGIVRIDPELSVLAKVSFKPSTTLLNAQLDDKDDALGRTMAVELLTGNKDQKTVARLKKVLNEDSFHGVRIAASKALRKIGNSGAYKALIASTSQADARVRRQVVVDLGSFFKPDALAALKDILKSEKNPTIRADALRALAGHDDADAEKRILQALKSSSFRHQLADAAISAIRKKDEPAHAKPLLATLKADEKKFTTRGFASGLKALAHLSRNADKKDEIRRYLVSYINNLNERKRLAAIEALGTLGDSRAIAVLEKIAGTGDESRTASAAESAIAKLNADKKPAEALKGVNKDLAELKKANEKLTKQIEDLKKRFEASGVPEEKTGDKKKD